MERKALGMSDSAPPRWASPRWASPRWACCPSSPSLSGLRLCQGHLYLIRHMGPAVAAPTQTQEISVPSLTLFALIPSPHDIHSKARTCPLPSISVPTLTQGAPPPASPCSQSSLLETRVRNQQHVAGVEVLAGQRCPERGGEEVLCLAGWPRPGPIPASSTASLPLPPSDKGPCNHTGPTR